MPQLPAVGQTVSCLRGVRILGGSGEPVDVHIRDGRITDVTLAGAIAGVPGVTADGMWIMPGLWDHHVHAGVAALTADRVDLSAASSYADAAERMAVAPIDGGGRRVGGGYRVATWPDEPRLEALDAATGDVPTYLINADLHSAWLNSAALEREGFRELAGETGMLSETPAFAVSARLSDVSEQVTDAAVARLLARAAARGVVGLVDFDFDTTAETWVRRFDQGATPMRVQYNVYPPNFDRWLSAGITTGMASDPAGLIRAGSLKFITDGSLGTRTAACTCAYDDEPANFGEFTFGADEVGELMQRATDAGITVAAHAIGDATNRMVIDAFAATGASGTIEHAQLMAAEDIARLAHLRVAASVQPEHTLDDRELLARYWQGQTAVVYPLASLLRAGVPVLLGSDAPVAPLDPWIAMSAAIFRRRGDEPAYHPEEALTFEQALAASTRSRVAVGEPADLVLLNADPTTLDAAALREAPVALTLLAGQVTHSG